MATLLNLGPHRHEVNLGEHGHQIELIERSGHTARLGWRPGARRPRAVEIDAGITIEKKPPSGSNLPSQEPVGLEVGPALILKWDSAQQCARQPLAGDLFSCQVAVPGAGQHLGA